MKSKVITIEGVDGSGKNTQSSRVLDFLLKKGVPAVKYSFPCYEDTFFGKEIGSYLRGEYGGIDEVSPRLVSMLFAGDRFEKKEQMIKDLSSGKVLIVDRYVDSNLAHQCAKLRNDERDEFIAWAEMLEYQVFGLPRADLTFFLDMPADFSKELVLKKAKRSYTNQKEDIHERNHDYMNEVYEVYRYLAKRRGWAVIDCVERGELKSPSAISEEVMKRILGA